MNKKYSVFVSSTYEDLKDERQEVVNALLQMDCFPVGMEFFNASDQSQWEVIKGLIDECDYYVLIIAGRYGSVEPKSGKSYTQLEYEYARSKGVPTIAFLFAQPEEIPSKNVEKEHVAELELFRKDVQTSMVNYWSSPKELASQMVLSLHKLFRTHPRVGWIKADEKSSAEQNKEILRLREENEKLQEKIKSFEENEPTGVDSLCQGEDEFEIKLLGVEEEFISYEEFSYKLTWNEICKILLPHMFQDCWEHRLPDFLAEYISEKVPKYQRVSVKDYSFQIIKVQLMALGLITSVPQLKSTKDNISYWTLTKYGKNVLMRLTALRRENIPLIGK